MLRRRAQNGLLCSNRVCVSIGLMLTAPQKQIFCLNCPSFGLNVSLEKKILVLHFSVSLTPFLVITMRRVCRTPYCLCGLWQYGCLLWKQTLLWPAVTSRTPSMLSRHLLQRCQRKCVEAAQSLEPGVSLLPSGVSGLPVSQNLGSLGCSVLDWLFSQCSCDQIGILFSPLCRSLWILLFLRISPRNQPCEGRQPSKQEMDSRLQ